MKRIVVLWKHRSEHQGLQTASLVCETNAMVDQYVKLWRARLVDKGFPIDTSRSPHVMYYADWPEERSAKVALQPEWEGDLKDWRWLDENH